MTTMAETTAAASPAAPEASARTTTLAVTGWGVVGAGAVGAEEFSAAAGTPAGPVDVRGMFEDPLPRRKAFAMTGFDVREHLGRKGTSTYDRSTSLSMVACKLALADTDLVVDDANRERIGIVLGTTAGSAKSTSDYSRESFTSAKPYLVNPLIFPNAVMNCAAGQAAIRYELKGVNATLAAGDLAGVSVVRYARNLIACDYAEALLIGAVEEFSPHSAWGTHFMMRDAHAPTLNGEGAAVLVVENAAKVRAEGRPMDAEILAAEFGQYGPPGSDLDPGQGLRTCIERALARAGVRAGDVAAVASAENGIAVLDRLEDTAIRDVLGDAPRRIRVKERTGEAYSASSVFQIAALLARHRRDPGADGQVSVATFRSALGSVGAVVLRGWNRGSRDHGI